jgi:hypothetical protein
VSGMAYTRNESEKLEIDYSVEDIWAAIPTVVKHLEWTVEEKDDKKHKAKLKTKAGFLAYSSFLEVELTKGDEKTTRMTINAETPVTTITSVVDFGRTRERVEIFIGALAKFMEQKK